jgi:nitrate/TMAO reductase-like tetraheme cytochrome c subunit
MRIGQLPDGLHGRTPLDSLAVESPVPAIQPLFNFLLNQPAWIVTVGTLFLLAVAGWAGIALWRRRVGLRAWFAERSRGTRLALTGVVLAAVLIVAGTGGWLYNYTAHENAFCSSCHIMNDAYMRFAGSEHADLGCHDCHRQSVYASVRQLVLWVAERPDEIPPHSPVPTEVCAECHVRWEPDSLWMTGEAWRHVLGTAGHRIHLESSDTTLADVQCVSCHGQQVHSFIPVESTCLECHQGLEIRLGRMASAPQAFHCAGCHEFTAPVRPAVAGAVDAVRLAISPRIEQCHGCHAMEQLLPPHELAADPHQAACGLCHNPHTHLSASQASASCTAAGCHDAVEPLTPYHRGLRAGVLADCTHCHGAHSFTATGARCLDCHTDIYSDRPAGRGRLP